MSVESAARELWYVLQVETEGPQEAARALVRALAEHTPEVSPEQIIGMLSGEVGRHAARKAFGEPCGDLTEAPESPPEAKVVYLPTYKPKERRFIRTPVGRARY